MKICRGGNIDFQQNSPIRSDRFERSVKCLKVISQIDWGRSFDSEKNRLKKNRLQTLRNCFLLSERRLRDSFSQNLGR
jgi:hypothetical protein